MKIYTKIINQQVSSDTAIETVSLGFDERKRGRLKIHCDSGSQAGIQIDRGVVLRDGALLADHEGNLLRVFASKESVSTAYIDNVTLFARGCYHLGNRHVSLQIADGFLRFQTDYVLDEMLHGLGIHVVHEVAEFEPESGAYAKGHSHGHQHDHTNAGEHSHDH